MRAILSFALVLMIGIAVSAAASAAQQQALIVPNHRIGPARLGMSRATIDKINRTALCPVLANYDASGGAVWLETHWGGSCLITDKIQVGLPFGPAYQTFGKPDRITEDAWYPHATASWVVYQDRGIAFRVLGWSTGAIIQTIAVFPRLDSHPANELGGAYGSNRRDLAQNRTMWLERAIDHAPSAPIATSLSDGGNGDGAEPPLTGLMTGTDPSEFDSSP